MVGIQKLPKSDGLVLNISVKLIKSAYCSQFNMVYITVSDLLNNTYVCSTKPPRIQNTYAGAYLEDFVQKHLQARTLV